MFSNDNRCSYCKSPLSEVICQLRFPEILTIGTTVPAEFQEEIRQEFPQYQARQESPAPKIIGAPGNFRLENPPSSVNYQFTSADGIWRVNLTTKFISIATTNYAGWEDFAARLDKPLAAFIRLYKPAYFERIGLRYVNFISRKTLDLEGYPYKELIRPCYLGILAEEDLVETGISRCSVDMELNIHGGCKAKIHAGPGLVKKNGVQDPEVKFIFDQDLYLPGKLPLNLSAGALQTLHAQAYSIFRGAVTETLHNAMEPTQL